MNTRFSLATETHSLTVIYTRGDFEFQSSFTVYTALAAAFFARILDDGSLALAMMASAADAKEALLIPNLPLSLAGGTGAGARAGRSPTARTELTRFHPRDLDFGLQAKRGFHEGEFEVVAQVITALGGTATPAAPHNVAEAEQVAKDVAELAKDSWIEAGGPRTAVAMTKPIIMRALLLIAQNAVGFRSLLEFFFSRVVSLILIRVVFHREFAVGALDLLVGGRAADTQDFVVVTLAQTKSPSLFRVDVRAVQPGEHVV